MNNFFSFFLKKTKNPKKTDFHLKKPKNPPKNPAGFFGMPTLNQIGFRKGFRTADHVFTLKTIVDQSFKNKEKLYTCFVGLEKHMIQFGEKDYSLRC